MKNPAYPNGQCGACGFGLNDEGECCNFDCSSSKIESKRFTIVITGEVPVDVPDEYIDYMAGTAEVQVLEPLIQLSGDAARKLIDSGEGGSFTDLPGSTPQADFEFETRNVSTVVASDSLLRTFLDLSTSHLPQPVLIALMQDDKVTLYEHHDYGFFIHVYGDEEDDPFPEWYPPELITVVRYARTLNADYICFDRDGMVDPHLPVWEW